MLTATPIRILIVDDNLLILAATKTVLASCKYFSVIGESSNPLVAIKMAEEMRPDVVLMDINMQPVDGIEATRRLLVRNPGYCCHWLFGVAISAPGAADDRCRSNGRDLQERIQANHLRQYRELLREKSNTPR